MFHLFIEINVKEKSWYFSKRAVAILNIIFWSIYRVNPVGWTACNGPSSAASSSSSSLNNDREGKLSICVLQLYHSVQEKLRLTTWTKIPQILNFFLLLSCAELLVLKNIRCNWAKWGERMAYGALTRASDSAVHFPFPQLQLWQHPALCYLHQKQENQPSFSSVWWQSF